MSPRIMPQGKQELWKGLKLGEWNAKCFAGEKTVESAAIKKTAAFARKNMTAYRKAVEAVEKYESRAGKKGFSLPEEELNRRKVLRHTLALSIIGTGRLLRKGHEYTQQLPKGEILITKNKAGEINFKLIAQPKDL
ncbi:MAG: hypothetical protein V1494_02100 [Candidatus Diapherotrites archaeon]